MTFFWPKGRPIRKVTSRSSDSVRGYFTQGKHPRPIEFESQIEEACIYVMEARSFVVRYDPQPCQLVYEFGSRERKYVPDFFVRTRHGQFFLEVKPRSVLEDFEEMRRLQIIRWNLQAQGYHFRLITDRELRAKPLLPNCRRIIRYRHPEFTPDKKVLRRLSALPDRRPMPAAEMADCLGLCELEPGILALIHRGHLTMAYSKPFSAAAFVWRPGWEACNVQL